MKKTRFHAGEIEVQTKAGVQDVARQVGRIIKTEIPEEAAEFLQDQPMLVVGSQDSEGQMWASLLTGLPGFVQTTSDTTLQIYPDAFDNDPLFTNLSGKEAKPVGLMAIELETRTRIRLNGQAKLNPAGNGASSIEVTVEEYFGNCPKYIQSREFTNLTAPTDHKVVKYSTELTPAQAEWVSLTDTFFIATAHPEGGVDVSHRGGLPGFVHIENSQRLAFPDYSGNRMFQTLGNLASNPQAGLLLVNFTNGDILQLTGQATINWDKTRISQFPGAERVVEFEIAQVVQQTGAVPLRWKLLEYSRFNPGQATRPKPVLSPA